MKWMRYISHLFFPEFCFGCNTTLFLKEKMLCLNCKHHLPKTQLWQLKEHEMSKMLWGRCDMIFSSAFLYFKKDNITQQILHHIKYNHQKEFAIWISELYGHDIKSLCLQHQIDYLIPVPLHPKKERLRGYNQSLLIAQGISNATGVAILTQNLIRTEFTQTQTKKARYARFENVKDKFEIKEKDILKHKTIAIVDDVFTTGSTIESCYNALQDIEGIKIGVLTLAFAIH